MIDDVTLRMARRVRLSARGVLRALALFAAYALWGLADTVEAGLARLRERLAAVSLAVVKRLDGLACRLERAGRPVWGPWEDRR